MTANPDDLWIQLIQLHQCSKEIFLRAEETDSSFKSFIQPGQELKHAYEHIIRAQAANLKINNAGEQYAYDNLHKALGHEYRAFFDAADWLSISIRDKIIQSMAPYSNSCINSVFPEYYHDIRPRIERVSKEIAKIRVAKDISRNNDILSEVGKYQNEINTLLDFVEEIPRQIPALEEFKSKELSEETRIDVKTAKWNYLNWIYTAIIAILSIMGAYLLGKYYG
jgi:hypothetical protein